MITGLSIKIAIAFNVFVMKILPHFQKTQQAPFYLSIQHISSNEVPSSLEHLFIFNCLFVFVEKCLKFITKFLYLYF